MRQVNTEPTEDRKNLSFILFKLNFRTNFRLFYSQQNYHCTVFIDLKTPLDSLTINNVASYLRDTLLYPIYATLTWFSNQRFRCLFSCWSELNDDLALPSVKQNGQASVGENSVAAHCIHSMYTNHFHDFSPCFQKLLFILCFLKIENNMVQCDRQNKENEMAADG